MYRRIEPHQVELGMFIHKLEGNWLDHPFWRARFLLNDNARLERLRTSAIPGVIIDTERGRDLDETADLVTIAAEPEPAEQVQGALLPPAGKAPERRSPAPAVRQVGNLVSCPPGTIAREFGQAAALAERSKRTVSRAFLRIRLGNGFKTAMVEPVIDEVFGSIERNAHAFHGLLRCQHDNQPLYRHALATAALMISFARQLGLSPEQIRHAGLAGLLLDAGITRLPVDLGAMGHDLGRVPPEVYRTHVEHGEALCAETDVPEPVATAIAQHHERIDGRGYPRGLRRAELSLLGRMAAICDAYDDLTGGDCGKSLQPAEAVARICADEGAFASELLAAFVDAIGVYPIGSVVLLRSGRLAMVVDQSPAAVNLPRVVTFFSTISGHKLAAELIDLSESDADAIEASTDPERWGMSDFLALREKLFTYACHC